MKKEELIQEAITVWCNYGKAINIAFKFNDFYIDSQPLQNIISSGSEERIKSFISYVQDKIKELEQMEE